jgi:IclR family acetate operon transcriptional repressor
MDLETVSPLESVDRALRLLEVLASRGAEGATLAEVASVAGMHKTTAHRTLGALRHRDFVGQDPETGRYRLGRAAVALADRYLDEGSLPSLLHGALVALCSATDELVHLGVLSGAEVVYLDKVEPDRAVRVWSAVGRRRWAATTALGRAMLAYAGTSRELVDGYVRATGAGASPHARAVDGDHVWFELERARTRGYAVETGENEQGIACVAVPLVRGSVAASGGATGRSGAVVAAVSLTAPIERMSDDRVAQLHRTIREVLPPLLPAGLTLPPR